MSLVRTRGPILFLLMAAALCALEAWIVLAAPIAANPDMLSLAITVDLTLGIPLLGYLLLIRPHRLPVVTLAPMFLLSVAIAYLILPSSQQTHLDRVALLLPLIEGAAVVLVGVKLRSIARRYRRIRPATRYGSDALRLALREVFGDGPALSLAVVEPAYIYYAMTGWFTQYRSTSPEDRVFSYHRRSGYGATLGMMGGLVAIETVIVHALVQHWSTTAAWVLTGLSIYTLIVIIGDFHAIRLHPIVLGSRLLALRCGLRARIDVPIDQIAGVRRARASEKLGHKGMTMSATGEARLVIELRKPMIAHGMFGRQHVVLRIGLMVDDEAQFVAELQQRIAKLHGD